jgi:hypothetical protein
MDKFIKHVEDPDDLVALISTHKDMAFALSELVAESMIDEHFVELDRLSFPLKVDLAIGLGHLNPVMRSPLLKFNSIRNDMTHGETELNQGLVRDFYNACNDPQIRKRIETAGRFASIDEWKRLFRHLIILLFVEITGSLERARDEKLKLKLAHERLQTVMDKVIEKSPHLATEGTDDGLDDKFNILKAERQKKGGY